MDRNPRRPAFLGALLLLLVFGMLGPAGSIAGSPGGGWGGLRTDELQLTEDQSRALADLQRRFRREVREWGTRIMAKRLEIRTLSREEFGGSRGSELQAEIKTLYLARRERALYYQAEALKILREDQRERLPAGSDLGFRCAPGFGGGGPGRGWRRNRSDPPGPDEKPSAHP